MKDTLIVKLLPGLINLLPPPLIVNIDASVPLIDVDIIVRLLLPLFVTFKEAVLLWEEYLKNENPKALETLLAYNIQDVVNLETFMVLAYNLKLRETPFNESHQLGVPSSPESPFKADLETIKKVKGQVMENYWMSLSRWSYPGYPTRSY